MSASKCKRMVVNALGCNSLGKVEHGRNYNLTKCTQEEGNCGCVHAEIALLKKMPNPEIVVVTHAPCLKCAEALVTAGVRHVYFLVSYRKWNGVDYLIDNGVLVSKLMAYGVRQITSLSTYKPESKDESEQATEIDLRDWMFEHESVPTHVREVYCTDCQDWHHISYWKYTEETCGDDECGCSYPGLVCPKCSSIMGTSPFGDQTIVGR